VALRLLNARDRIKPQPAIYFNYLWPTLVALCALLLIAHYVEGVQALGTLLALKIDRIPLIQDLEATLLNRREMHKYVFASGTLNETVSFSAIEPLHYTTFSHKYSPSLIMLRMGL
jgi:hypothetical protein